MKIICLYLLIFFEGIGFANPDTDTTFPKVNVFIKKELNEIFSYDNIYILKRDPEQNIEGIIKYKVSRILKGNTKLGQIVKVRKIVADQSESKELLWFENNYDINKLLKANGTKINARGFYHFNNDLLELPLLVQKEIRLFKLTKLEFERLFKQWRQKQIPPKSKTSN